MVRTPEEYVNTRKEWQGGWLPSPWVPLKLRIRGHTPFSRDTSQQPVTF